jgi:hypothetical protein
VLTTDTFLAGRQKLGSFGLDFTFEPVGAGDEYRVQIRQLSVWDLRPPSRQLTRIVEPERISKIRSLLHQLKRNEWTGRRTDSGLHIEFSLDGLHRSLRQFRVGKRELHVRVRTWWSQLSISDQETEELVDLLGLDMALLRGNDD